MTEQDKPPESAAAPPAETAAPPPGRKGRWRQRLGCGCLATLFALVVGVLGLEWFLRTYSGHFLGAPAQANRMYQLDGHRSFKPVPGWRGEQTVEGVTTQIRINSRGMRGADMGAKPPHETRIAVFGDSFVFGHGAAEDQTIPARLEQGLRERTPHGKTVRVGNCGVSGQGVRDGVRSMRRHQGLNADLLIFVCYIGNDFLDDCREYTAITEGYLLMGGMARAAFESTRFRLTLRYRSLYLLEQVLVRYAPSLAFDRSQLGQTEAEAEALRYFPPPERHFGSLFFDRRSDDALVQKILTRTGTSLTAMREIAGETPLLIVWMPSRWHVDAAAWRKRLIHQGFDPAAHRLGLAQERLTTLAGELRLKSFDLTSKLAAGGPGLWFEKDSHLNPEGYRTAGHALAAAAAEFLGW